jgi:2-methylcitrate dehydratase PrpD
LHAAIDAALAARAALGIAEADDIESVTIEADPTGHTDQFIGGPAKRRPTQVVEAQFAQPFLVATALVHGIVGIAEVAGLGNTSVLALSDRIVGVALDSRPKGSLSIKVHRTDGRSVTVEAETVFRKLAETAGPYLKRLPDGETGIRKTWIRFLQDVLAQNPAIERTRDVPPSKFTQWDGKLIREIQRRSRRASSSGGGPADPPAPYDDGLKRPRPWRSENVRTKSGFSARIFSTFAEVRRVNVRQPLAVG